MLRIISIEDLIAYRLQHESFLRRVAVVPAMVAGLNASAYAYETPFDQLQQVALVIGDVDGKENVPVRLYREQPLHDLLCRANGDGDLMEKAVAEIKARDRAGVLIMLRKPHAIEPAADEKKAPQRLEAAGAERHESARARMQRWREVGVGAQILRDLGVRSIALMTSHPRQYVGLGGFGIAISETIVLK